ncbi:MAG: hypothetical protein EOP48_19665 [Sphingobacteriales bacterium]|nr:MAG: hypothetical protein EOP48_19665 [Sphingobacteriales bacterium]
MKCQLLSIALTSMLIVSLTACKDHQQEPNVKQDAVSSTSSSSAPNEKLNTDQWLGKWNGPEGTFLNITGGNGKYELIIQDLDDPKNYTGVTVDNTIQFERNGILEKIHATNGADTGMKWLSEKSDCLTIHVGEGFCRN